MPHTDTDTHVNFIAPLFLRRGLKQQILRSVLRPNFIPSSIELFYINAHNSYKTYFSTYFSSKILLIKDILTISTTVNNKCNSNNVSINDAT